MSFLLFILPMVAHDRLYSFVANSSDDFNMPNDASCCLFRDSSTCSDRQVQTICTFQAKLGTDAFSRKSLGIQRIGRNTRG